MNIPRNEIDSSLEILLRYEKKMEPHLQASPALLIDLADENNSPWKQFLLSNDGLAITIEQALKISRQEAVTPLKTIASTKVLVEKFESSLQSNSILELQAYVGSRSYIPAYVRSRSDIKATTGEIDTSLAITAIAKEWHHLGTENAFKYWPHGIEQHWYEFLINGGISAESARCVPNQIRDAVTSLVDYHASQMYAQPVPEADVIERYKFVFTAPDIKTALKTVLDTYAIRLRIDPEQIEPFLRNLSPKEILERFRKIRDWMGTVYIYDMVITTKLAEYLSQPGDFDPLLTEIDRLSKETTKGNFRPDNTLQRDIEFRRFLNEYTKHNAVNKRLPYLNEPSRALYGKFEQLQLLPTQEDEKPKLSAEHRHEAKRVAYEANELLSFLKRMRERTDRTIVVVGNDRYGRQWIVEPLEDFLDDGFVLRYDRSPSHMSTPLDVGRSRQSEIDLDDRGPWTSDIFPREFVRWLGKVMPHVVIADTMSPNKNSEGLMRIPRSNHSYANWFIAFNDVRTDGNFQSLANNTFLPKNHLEEVVKWHEYVGLRRQLLDWIDRGETYRMATWSPEPTEMVKFGESVVPYIEPKLTGDRPMVVFANPVYYNPENLPEEISDTNAYYFDGPERIVQEEILLGFGNHGFETRLKGTTTAQFVSAVQGEVTTQISKSFHQKG